MAKIYLMMILVLAASGCQPVQNLICSADESEEPLEEEAEAPVMHETMTIERQDITSHKLYPASIEGRQTIRIIPRIDGYLREIRIKEGTRVKRGQVLFVMDQAAYKAELSAAKASVSMAQASLSTAQLNYNSRKVLFDKSIISEQELLVSQTEVELAKAQLEQANAQFELAQTNLSYTTIKSPSDGIVGRMPFYVGDFVGSTLTDGLTTIADTHEMSVYFSLSETEVVSRVAEYGSLDKMIEAFPPVSLKLVDGSLYKEEGHIESVSGIVDQHTGALSLRAVFPNADGILLSGGSGQLIVPNIYKQVIVIPQEAAYEILDKHHVYKIVEGRTQAVVIQVVPLSDGTHYLVTGGLEEGDQIIARGAAYLRDGMTLSDGMAPEDGGEL